MTLSDLKSKGGSFVNERAVTAAPVVPGDRLRLGMMRFTVVAKPPGER
jgi:pSer/pThr/pTyr-binding forkhead associated (FHA) protein